VKEGRTAYGGRSKEQGWILKTVRLKGVPKLTHKLTIFGLHESADFTRSALYLRQTRRLLAGLSHHFVSGANANKEGADANGESLQDE
jgi:hypothetical protein